MTDAQTYTLEDAHRQFAKASNGQVWDLLQKPDRSKAEDALLVHAAHASCYHWLQVGTGLHHQRAEWLIAHVYTVLGVADQALVHASRCYELTREHAALLKDFDRAYAFEGLARANALAGNREDAIKYKRLADEAGQVIVDAEDRSIFQGDLNSGDWHGVG